MKIRLFTKVLSMLLSAVFILSIAIVGVNAVEEETEEFPIFLDISNTDWSINEDIFCHIWNTQTGEIYNEWCTSAEKMTVSEYDDTILEFDLASAITDFTTSEEKNYGLIFINERGSQTHTLVISGYCYYEIVYLTEDTSYAPQDGSKRYYGEFCGFSYDYGTHLQIDNSNRVFGHALFENETRASLLANYIVDKCLYGTSTFDTDTLNQLLDDIQATVRDTKTEVEKQLKNLMLGGVMTSEQAQQLEDKIFSALDLCTDPVIEKNIYFDVYYSGWGVDDTYYCDVLTMDNSGYWTDDESADELCEFDEAAGVAIYDLNNTGRNISGDEIKHLVMFRSDSGEVSPFATMNGNCVGDSAYVVTYWDDHGNEFIQLCWENSRVCGPIKEIYDNGEVTGFSLPYGMTDEMVISEYLIKNADNLDDIDVQYLIDVFEVGVKSVKSQVKKDIGNEDEEKLAEIMAVLDECTDSEYMLIFGDVNQDNIVNVTDATAIAKYLAEIDDIDEYLLKYADVNRDGVVSIMDVTQIQKIVVELI